MSRIIKGYKPHDNQRLIHDSINHGEYKYYALNIGRQFGKTMLGINQMLYWAINDRGCNIAWITPVYKQSKKVFDEMEKVTRGSGLFEFHRSDLWIKGFGSTIQFFSGEKPDNIRGNTFDYLIVDEMAFTRAELWDEVLSATVLVKGKKVIFISTPKGRNHFHRICMQHNYDERYKYFHFTSFENPLIDHQDLEERKRSLPDHIFRQEYLAEFIDNASGIFRNVKECIGKGEKTAKMYGGLDIGRADDYTVLTIMNDKGEQVAVERWRHEEWSRIIDRVADAIRKWNALTLVEVNNQGDVFYEMLQQKCRNLVEPFVTSSASKPVLIEDLAVSFEQKEIRILDHQWLVDELEAFTYIYNINTRSVKYSAPDGMHDDGVISTALAWHCRKHYSKRGQYKILRA
jgi:phage terminase large subunit-like protein